MALITCPECGKQVSDKAAACIHCGYPIQALTQQKNELLLARRARKEGNTIDAEKYYSSAYKADPNDWEAAFFQRYYQIMNEQSSDLLMLSSALSEALPEIISNLKNSDVSDKEAAIHDMLEACDSVAQKNVKYGCQNLRSPIAFLKINPGAKLVSDLAKAVEEHFSEYPDTLETIHSIADKNANNYNDLFGKICDNDIARLKRETDRIIHGY